MRFELPELMVFSITAIVLTIVACTGFFGGWLAACIEVISLNIIFACLVYMRGYKMFGIGPRPRWRTLTAPEGNILPHLRFVAISDTHSLHHRMREIPKGDVLIHAGDFTLFADDEQVADFNHWLGTLPHKHKLVIAGNHDFLFDDQWIAKAENKAFWEKGTQKLSNMHSTVRGMLTNCQYIRDEKVVVDGVTIYATPAQPPLAGHDWAFCCRPDELQVAYAKIPVGIDVLLTHSPPYGHGDRTVNCQRYGCKLLLDAVKRVRPKFHVFGHVHDGYGVTEEDGTIFINASTTTTFYHPYHAPIVFDVPKRCLRWCPPCLR